MHTLGEGIMTQQGWDITKNTFDNRQAINDGSAFMIGNGYLGYRGTFAEERQNAYVGCIVTDTWNKADDKWEELCTVPNALYSQIYVQDTPLNLECAYDHFERRLDLSQAVSSREVSFLVDSGRLTLQEEKFASLTSPHLLAMRQCLTSDHDTSITVIAGIDMAIWSLNGEHLTQHTHWQDAQHLAALARTSQSNIQIAVLEKSYNLPQATITEHHEEGLFCRQYQISLKANEPLVLDKFMLVSSSNESPDPKAQLLHLSKDIHNYDDLKAAHAKAWQAHWQRFDIVINGHIADQAALRFNTYHAIIATPMHKPLPIGARGLSCQAYQGAAFWDQEIYNMPMYLFSHPEQAKRLLQYRYNTLNGARSKARMHGFEGAFYAWISGKTGEELCPDFFFKDVLSDRPIRNHFNLWQIHISPDIAYALDKYFQLTNDVDFMHDYGLEMAFEIARFLASRVDFKPRRDRYELIRVQGPDEYHENVDNNAFTNYQTHFVFKQVLGYLETFDAAHLATIKQRIHLSEEEVALWRDIGEKLYLPRINEMGLLEQFDHFFSLESILPAQKVTERLLDHGEYYGWPNGITVFTQCNKQADIIQLFALHPSLFDTQTQWTNYLYYEPRTLHFSSLSPSTHALVAARLDQRDEAYRHFQKAVMIDLLNTNEAVSGGTFIGGMHTANNGSAWSMVANGFLGLDIDQDADFKLDPHLPDAWKSVELNLVIKGQALHICVDNERINISIKEQSGKPAQPLQLLLRNTLHTIDETLSLRLN